MSSPPPPQPYLLVFATVYIINIPMRIAFFTSAVSELAIIMNRLYVVQNLHNPFSKMSKIQFLTFCFIFPMFDGFLPFVGLQIYDFPGMKGMYTWGFSEFGKSGFYQVFQIYNFVAETILPVFTLLALNIYTVRKLNEYVKTRMAITKKKDEAKNTKTKFTRMMVVFVALSVFVRSVDMITGIFIRLKVV